MARAYWDFRDQLSTDEGLHLIGPRIVILSCLCEEYLEKLQQGHLSATKVQQNAHQHLYWPGLDADIIDYTRRCQECIYTGLFLPNGYFKPWCATAALGMHSNGLLLCQWQVVYCDLWLFQKIFLLVSDQDNKLCQLEGPSTGAVCNRRHSWWDHEWQWPPF